MANIGLFPDGIGGRTAMYVNPTTEREANEWLNRYGIEKYKFERCEDNTVLKDMVENKAVLKGNAMDICYFIVKSELWKKKIGLLGCDWYIDSRYKVGNVEEVKNVECIQ